MGGKCFRFGGGNRRFDFSVFWETKGLLYETLVWLIPRLEDAWSVVTHSKLHVLLVGEDKNFRSSQDQVPM